MNPVVETTSGKVQGYHNGRCCYFGGIPFAASVDAEHRFKPPRPPVAWSEIRPAVHPGPVVPQNPTRFDPFLGPDPQPQSEDCLSVNVWTPAADQGKRPVFVWIHGGAYVSGSGSFPLYDGSALAARGDIVFVSINYRLGERGYLSLGHIDPDYESSGNTAVLDQIAALEWVRDNIAAFGGDPNCVTVGGQSAGAGSLTALMMAPAARGLLHRGIVQSISFMRFRDPARAVEATETFMKFAEADSIGALETLPIDTLLAAQRQTMRATPPWRLVGLQPRHGDSVLPKDILPAARDGEMIDIPVLVGTTSDEWNPFGFFMNPDDIPTTDGETIALLDEIVGRGEEAASLYRDVRGPLGALDLFNAVVGDWRWWAPAIRFLEALSGKQPIYAYEFAWKSPTHNGRLGAGHCVELPFCLHNLATPSTPYLIGDDAPVRLADNMADAWIAFIRTGTPQSPALGDWPSYDLAQRPVMTFDTDCALSNDPRASLREYWLADG